MTLRARSDRSLIRANHRSERYVLVEVAAPPAPPRSDQAARTPVNLALVLDRSGSMSGPKLELAKRAVETAISRLHAEDRFSVVVYDDVVDVVVESTKAGGEARHNAVERLRAIDARGSTDLAGGWLRGAEQVALHLEERGVNRVLLLTDGLANRGITDPTELTRHAQGLRARGVTTSTFGVGEDFDERLLQSMADAGGGHFYFIASAAQIADHISSEVGELLEVVAHEAAIEVTAGATIDVEALSPYPVEPRGQRWRVLLGDLVAEQRVEVVLRVRFGYGELGREVGLLVGLTDRDGTFGASGADTTAAVPLAWTYADDPANDAQPRDRSVDRVVARLFAERARQAAISLNRQGRYADAASGIERIARRIGSYAADDPVLRELIAELEGEGRQWAAPVPEMTRKVAFAAATYSLRSRGPEGRASR